MMTGKNKANNAPSESSFFRSRIKELTLLFFSFVVLFIIAEIFLQKFYPQITEHDQMFERDPELGWRFIPNKKGLIVYSSEAKHLIKTNSLGFRDGPPPTGDGEGKKILVIGDSFVSNISVKDDEVFTEVMEKELKDTAVLNFGVNGYGQVQEYLLLKKTLSKLTPDLIVLVIYIRNDFKDNTGGHWLHPRPYASLEGTGRELKINPPPEPRERDSKKSWKLYKRSHLYELIDTKLDILKNKLSSEDKSEFIPPEFYLCDTRPSEKTEKMQRAMEALLLEISGYAAAKEVPLVFALAPTIVQASDELWSNTILSKNEEAKYYDRSLPNDKLMRFAKDNGLSMIDLLPILRYGKDSKKPYYNLTEQHWNSEGNRAVAFALIKYLRAKKLIK